MVLLGLPAKLTTVLHLLVVVQGFERIGFVGLLLFLRIIVWKNVLLFGGNTINSSAIWHSSTSQIRPSRTTSKLVFVHNAIVLVHRDKDRRIFFHFPRYTVIAHEISLVESIQVVIGTIRR